MNRINLLNTALLSLFITTPVMGSNTVKPDPVVLTFSSEAGQLRMELGFIEELRLEASGEKYFIRVIFEYEGMKYYNSFAFPNRNLPTDLIICKEKVYTYAKMPYLHKGSFVLPIKYSKAEAEQVAELLWYGDNCENYL